MRRFLRVFLIIFVLSRAEAQGPATTSVTAAAGSAVSSTVNSTVNSTVATATSQARFSPQLRLWDDSFISPDYDATAARDFGFIGLSLKTPADSKWLTKMDIDAAFAFGAPLLSYLNFKELYLDIPFAEGNTGQLTGLQVGRKRSEWSAVDSRWNLGIWEPVFKWNPLTPESQGLTGLFLTFPWESVELEVMGSPLYLPDQGPSFQVSEDGQFERGNPWFHRPADTIRIWSETSKVEYNFQRPNESQVVLQRTYATRLRFKSDSYFLQASYAFKPMNQLPLAYDGSLNIPKDRGVVDIVTSVQYHEVTGADLQWHNNRWKLGISGLRDKPFGTADFEEPEKWTRPVYHEAFVTSPYLDWNFASGLTARLQYLNITGGEVEELGPLASKDRPSITRRYPFTQAESVEIEYQGRSLIHRAWKSSLNYTLSQKNQFDMIRWRGLVQLSGLWNIFSEAMLVRAEPETFSNQNDISEFENHDRLLFGVGYVF
jgi:hypothetical protein